MKFRIFWHLGGRGGRRVSPGRMCVMRTDINNVTARSIAHDETRSVFPDRRRYFLICGKYRRKRPRLRFFFFFNNYSSYWMGGISEISRTRNFRSVLSIITILMLRPFKFRFRTISAVYFCNAHSTSAACA